MRQEEHTGKGTPTGVLMEVVAFDLVPEYQLEPENGIFDLHIHAGTPQGVMFVT